MRRRVLLAEDSPELRQMITLLLERGGFQVTGVVDGRDAILKLRDERFDLLITDQTMPFATGEQVAAFACSLFPELPVLLLTGALEMADAPVDTTYEVLLKPIANALLLATVERLLQKA